MEESETPSESDIHGMERSRPPPISVFNALDSDSDDQFDVSPVPDHLRVRGEPSWPSSRPRPIRQRPRRLRKLPVRASRPARLPVRTVESISPSSSPPIISDPRHSRRDTAGPLEEDGLREDTETGSDHLDVVAEDEVVRESVSPRHPPRRRLRRRRRDVPDVDESRVGAEERNRARVTADPSGIRSANMTNDVLVDHQRRRDEYSRSGLVFLTVDLDDVAGPLPNSDASEMESGVGDESANGVGRQFRDDVVVDTAPAPASRQPGIYVENMRTGRFRHMRSMDTIVEMKPEDGVLSNDDSSPLKLAGQYEKFPDQVAALLLGILRLLTGLLAGFALLFLIVIYVPVTSYSKDSFLSFYESLGGTVQKILFSLVSMGFVCSVYVLVVRFRDSTPFERLIWILQSLLYVVIYVSTLVCSAAEDHFAAHDMSTSTAPTLAYYYAWHVMNGIRCVLLIAAFVGTTIVRITSEIGSVMSRE